MRSKLGAMNGHTVLLVIAILCELLGAGEEYLGAFYPEPNRRFDLAALGLVFYFISLLVPA
jgi:hypothetical protein